MAQTAVPVDHYAALGVARNATTADIKKSFRELALKCHPDRNPTGGAAFKCIVAAYEILSDDHRRRTYDAQFRIGPVAAQGARTARPASASAASPRFTSTGFGSASFSFQMRTDGGSNGAGQPNYQSSTGGMSWKKTTAATSATATAAQPSAAPATPAPTASAPSSADHDSAEKIERDRQDAKGVRNVSGYTLPREEQDRLKAMQERFESAQQVDLNGAWDRIRRRPMSAVTRPSSEHTPASSFEAPPPPPPAPAPAPASCDLGNKSASSFSRGNVPVTKPPPPIPQPSTAREFLFRTAPPMESNLRATVPQAPVPTPSAPPSACAPSSARRPFSAGVSRPPRSTDAAAPPHRDSLQHQHQNNYLYEGTWTAPRESSTNAESNPTTAAAALVKEMMTASNISSNKEAPSHRPSGASSSPTPTGSGPETQSFHAAPQSVSPTPEYMRDTFTVPTDSDVSAMDVSEAKELVSRLEHKLKIARQVFLLKSLS